MYGDYHSHSAQDVGAAPDGHHHSAYDVGAAPESHYHYIRDLDAAPENHEHMLSQIAGAASDQDVEDLRGQGRQQWERLTSAEDAIRALQARNTELLADLEAERHANAILRSGVVTIPLLVSALRAEAQDLSGALCAALSSLANTIEKEART